MIKHLQKQQQVNLVNKRPEHTPYGKYDQSFQAEKAHH